MISLDLLSCETKCLSGLGEILTNDYFILNLESADSIYPPNNAFQMMISNTPCKRNHGLKQIKDQLKHTQLNLYFVVPSDRFLEFKKQPYNTAWNEVVKNPPDLVHQWVLCIKNVISSLQFFPVINYMCFSFSI